jgi:hypothetical protein
MKEELISLANKLEFSGYLSKEWEHNTNEPLRYYFWMCELQKWLRDKYGIHITIDHVDSTIEYYYDYTLVTENDREFCDEDFTDQAKHHYHYGKEWEYKTYEIALERGLVEALNLINK